MDCATNNAYNYGALCPLHWIVVESNCPIHTGIKDATDLAKTISSQYPSKKGVCVVNL